jgi:hypothetical protein
MNAPPPSCSVDPRGPLNALEPMRRRSAAECGPATAEMRPKGDGDDEKFGKSSLVDWSPCKPLKFHKTAKALFGKAWTKTA